MPVAIHRAPNASVAGKLLRGLPLHHNALGVDPGVGERFAGSVGSADELRHVVGAAELFHPGDKYI